MDHLEAEVRRQCGAWNLELRFVADFALATVEVATNVMEHSGAHWIEVQLEKQAASVGLSIRDDGEAFDSVEMASYFDAPVAHLGLDRHMGLYIIGRLDFEKTYRRLEPGVNELTFKRAL